MRKIVILSFLIVLSVSSCNSLDEDPQALIVADHFYNTIGEADAAVVAAYNGLNSGTHTLYNRLIQISTEMATDDYEAGPRARNAHVRAIANLTHDTSNDRMLEIWRQSYDGINRANVAIDNIAKNTALDAQKAANLVNEAKFLRAVFYFNLVRWFAGVPVILHETSSLNATALHVSNATEEEVYKQIEADLIDAENLPKIAAVNGRATSGAAKSVLSKVYLTQKKWALAAKISKEVIDSKVYDLFENYEDVFNVATKNGKEHIFSAQFKGLTNWNGNMLASSSAPTSVPGIAGDQADALHVESGLFEAFAENDKRKYVTFGVSYLSPTDGKTYETIPHFNKYFDLTTAASPGQSSKNIPIIRFAEVLLIYAEAENELNGPTSEAFAAIDRVRTRAGIPLLSITSPTISKDDFREAVFEERRKELVYEYQRWFDLARRGADYYVAKLKAAGKTNAQPKHIHFPIPQRELDLNPNLKQLPDWKK